MKHQIIVLALTILNFLMTTPVSAQSGLWSDVGGGVADSVECLAVHDDGTGEALYVGGSFLEAGGQPASRVARWDGQAWSAVGSGIPGDVDVFDLEVFDDGSGAGPRLYASGNLDAGGFDNVVVWDGQSWSDVGFGKSGTVWTMAVFDDGSGPALYVGGNFSSAGGQPVSNIAKWDGREWSDVNGGVHYTDTGGPWILDLMVWDDGNGPGLIVAGRFTQAGGGTGTIVARGIARWRNGQWSTFGQDGLPRSGYARCLTTWPPKDGSSLVVGGWFSVPPFKGFSGLALWNGEAWQDIAPTFVTQAGPLDPGANSVCATRVGDCDQLFMNAAGYSESPVLALLRWNGDTWRPMDGGITSNSWYWDFPGSMTTVPSDFAIFQDRVYMGGSFASLGELPINNIAIWEAEVALQCAADGNQDGEINVDDLVAVILQWGACGDDDCAADNAPCGGDGDVNVDDLVSVIISWGACP